MDSNNSSREEDCKLFILNPSLCIYKSEYRLFYISKVPIFSLAMLIKAVLVSLM